MIFTVEKSLKDLDEKLSAEDKAALEEAVKSAKEDLAGDDDERIRAASEKLANESQAIFAKIYQQAGGAAGGESGPTGDDDENEFHQR